MDGKIIIGTEIDDKKFDRQIEDLQRKADKKQVDIDITTKNIQGIEKEIKRAKKERDAYFKQYEKLLAEQGRYEELKRMNPDDMSKEETREFLAGTFRNFNTEIEELDKKMNEATVGNFEELSQELQKQKEKLQDQQYEYKKISERIDEIKNKQKQLKLNEAQSNINNIGKSLNSVVKRVARLSLAVFGIRSAYNAIRNAINVISQDDEQLKADIDYMKIALAYTLEPIVRRIVELAKQLLFYIGYLIKQWTGRNIFENANKSLQKSNKSAKDLKKTLAGFDEMNILGDSSGGSSGATPSFDLSKIQGNVPKWLKWLGKNGKSVLKAVVGIYLALRGIKKLGIGIALYGIYTTIKNIVDFVKDPNFKSFVGVIEGIALTAVGIGIAIGAWPAIIAGALALIIIELVKNFDKIKEKFGEFNNWLDKNVLGWLEEKFGKIGDFIYIPIKTVVLLIENLFNDVFGGIKLIIEGIVKIWKGDFVGGITDIMSGLYSIIIKPIKEFYNSAKYMLLEILDLFGLIDKKKGGGSFGWGGSMGGRAKGGIFYPSKLPKLAVGGIINQPGSGVPYHGAVIGERGAEAVVPLTDSQQMALLGETIGRYVTINATIPVYAYNRQVDRQIKRIKAEDDFAFNR